VVLHGQLALGSCRAIDATKVKSGRCERDGIDCEDTEHAELDRQDLVSSGDLDGDSHRELLIGVFGGLFILLYEVAAACAKDRPVWFELAPDLKGAISLDEAQRRVELKVGAEVLRESQLDLHAVWRTIVEYNLFPVELLVDHDVEVVLFFRDINRHINAATFDVNRDGPSVVLVFEEERKLLVDVIKFVRHEAELNFRTGVAFNFNSALELDLS
jgi:hypothetical protein